MPHAAPSAKRTYRLLPKSRFSRVVLTIVLAAVGGHQFWGWREGRLLDVEIAQRRARGDRLRVEDYVRTDTLRENAARDLRAAAASVELVNRGDWVGLDDVPVLAAPLTEGEAARARTFVARHPDVFYRITSASAKPNADWGLRLRTPVQHVSLEHRNEQRPLVDFLILASLLAHHDGDHALAVKRCRDLLVVARALDQEPLLVPHLNARGIAWSSAWRLSNLAPTLHIGAGTGCVSESDVRACIAELLDDEFIRGGMRRSLSAEEALNFATAVGFVEGRCGLVGSDKVDAGMWLTRTVCKPLLLADAREVLRRRDVLVRAAADGANWPTVQKPQLDLPEHIRSQRRHVYATLFMSDQRQAVRTMFQCLTERHLAAASLAIRWYALEHNGALPGTLDDLVPRYLAAVPTDLMSAGNPIGYSAERKIVYSVGDDGVDAGGSTTPMNPKYPDSTEWDCVDFVLPLTPVPRRVIDVDTRTYPAGPAFEY